MAKSKVRGGKKKHRKRVENRNIAKKNAEAFQKKIFMEQLKKMQDTALVEEDVNGIVDGEELELDLDITDTKIHENSTVEAEVISDKKSSVKETTIMGELSPSKTKEINHEN